MILKQSNRWHRILVTAIVRIFHQPQIVYSVAILIVTLRSAFSAENSTPSDGWSIQELQQIAIESNPTIRQVIAEVNIFRGMHRQAGMYPNPQVGYVQTTTNGATPVRAHGGFVSQELVTSGKLRKAQNVQLAEIAHANANYDAQCRRVKNDVELRFIDTLALQESLALAKEGVDIANRDLAATEVRRNRRKKKAELSELVQARMRLRMAKHTVNNTAVHLETAWQQLVSVVGCTELGGCRLRGALDGEIPELDWNTCWSEITSTNPLLAATDARHQIASGNFALEKANVIPNVNAQVIADHDAAQSSSTVIALLSVSLPIFNRNQGNIDRAIAETHEAVAERDRTFLVLRDQLSEAFGRYRIAKMHVIELRDEFLPMAKENLDTIRKEFSDDPNAVEIFEAEGALLEAKMSLLDAWAELRKSAVEIQGQLLVGALNPAEVGAALQSRSGDVRRNAFRASEKNQSKQLVPALQLMSE